MILEERMCVSQCPISLGIWQIQAPGIFAD